MGDEAKAISFSNYKNTPINIKCLLGKQFNEPEVNLHLEAKNNSRQPRGGRIPCSGSREGAPGAGSGELMHESPLVLRFTSELKLISILHSSFPFLLTDSS
jgi:hypothetical protein